LHRDAAKWLIDNRKLKLFGLDAFSLDQTKDTEFRTHKVLLGAGVPGIENVANLDKLPPKGFEVFAFPLKIKGGTGGPTRVFARISSGPVDVNSAALNNHMCTALVTMVTSIGRLMFILASP